MTTRLTEDDIYRTSTQYRLWSFSPEQLAAQRKKTHQLALTRARQYASQQKGDANGDAPEYLTEEEELRLVRRYCELIRATSDHLKWPANIKVTAVQYLKRFYLSNSCITYPPKEIYKTVLFLATKTEAFHLTVTKFAQSISGDAEAILAPEYKVMQALRFTLDVRQPFRGLKGVMMELLNMAEGLSAPIEGVETPDLLSVKPPSPSNRTPWKAPAGSLEKRHLIDRIHAAYETSKSLLDAPASITDSYFLYTPSQILLAAMYLTDEPLTSTYLDTKLPVSSSSRAKILTTIHSCAELMGAYDGKLMVKAEKAALEEKLEACRDPTTRDLVKTDRDTKRNVREDGQGKKKRKVEREKNNKETDDLFGPSLEKVGGQG